MTTVQTVEAEGDSVEAAIQTALAELGTGRDRVDIEVLAEASRGVFGIGSRRARVRASLRQTADEVDDTAVAAEPLVESRYEGSVADYSDDEAADSTPITEATLARGRDLLGKIVELVGVSATVDARDDGDHLTLEILGDSSGLLIGRRGQMLDALEYIVSRALGRDEARSIHVTVDSEGYRSRRQQALEDLARRMGEEAKRRRRPVRLSDLSPRERRIVHLVLRQDRGLTTKSSGDGHLRTLVIIPKSVSFNQVD